MEGHWRDLCANFVGSADPTEQKTLGSDLAVIRDTLAWVDEGGVPKPRKFEAVTSKEIQRRKVGRK